MIINQILHILGAIILWSVGLFAIPLGVACASMFLFELTEKEATKIYLIFTVVYITGSATFLLMQ